jgi:hypothetical protein
MNRSIFAPGGIDPMSDGTYGPYRRELYELFVSLATSRERCEKLHDVLPVSPHEDEMLEGRLPTDFPTEARSTLECVLADSLTERLLASLRDAAEYGLEPSAPASE